MPVQHPNPREAPEAHADACRYSQGEEIAHGVTHGIGALCSVAALTLLVILAGRKDDPWILAGCTVFGISLVLLYTLSTLYHSVLASRAKRVLRQLDHAAIYLLIAGTYTPFALSVRGPWGWSILGAVWAVALFGVAYKLLSPRRYRALAVVSYLLLGWAAVAAMPILLEHVDSTGLTLLLMGGAAYTGGVAFYAWQSLPYHHAIWHLFVLAGSTFHVFAVLGLLD